MKLIALAATLILLAASCTKYSAMTVVRDCSGTYVRHAEVDYHVCNDSIIREYADGTKIKAAITKADSCPEQHDRMVCMLYHENQGWVRVKIKS